MSKESEKMMSEHEKEASGRVSLIHLAAWRRRALLTTRALAARAGTSKATIINIENGHTQANYATIGKLAQALGVSPQALLKAPPEDRGAAWAL